MALFAVTEQSLQRLNDARFATFGLRERRDLQRYLRDQIDAVDKRLYILSEEFGNWEEGSRRIDLLAVDKGANLVVIELKRTESGGHMELQAVRYAAMVANMTFDQAVAAHAEYLASRSIEADARAKILEFLDWNEPVEEDFGQDVKLLLISADFSRELTTSVLWLIDKGVDLRCFRVKPYQYGKELLVNIEQVLPLPEAQDYMIGVRKKSRKEKESRERDLTKFDVIVSDERHVGLPKRRAIFTVVKALCDAGHPPEEVWDGVPRSYNTAWRVVDGEVDSETFEELATRAAENGGLAFDPRRWFFSDEDLICSNGKTYSFSKMWGIRTEAIIQQLLIRFSNHEIRVSQSESDLVDD
jgi:hypothetical protein